MDKERFERVTVVILGFSLALVIGIVVGSAIHDMFTGFIDQFSEVTR